MATIIGILFYPLLSCMGVYMVRLICLQQSIVEYSNETGAEIPGPLYKNVRQLMVDVVDFNKRSHSLWYIKQIAILLKVQAK